MSLLINNCTRTVWSPIRPVIIRVITTVRLVITSVITNRIGRQEVQFLIIRYSDVQGWLSQSKMVRLYSERVLPP